LGTALGRASETKSLPKPVKYCTAQEEEEEEMKTAPNRVLALGFGIYACAM
jgi:hypothetical protein